MKTTPPTIVTDKGLPTAPATATAHGRAPAVKSRRAVPKAANDGPRGGDARAIADLMPAIGATSFRKFGFIQSAIVTRWADIVGEKFGAITRPDALRFPQGQKAEGTLHLTIAGAHAPMLQHVAPELIDRVNRFFGYRAVARVRMTQGLVVASIPVAASLPPIQPADRSHVEHAAAADGLRAVADDELRTVLERMAARLDQPAILPRIS